MKRVFKIIFLSFLCVAVALGLLIGGMYLFGGFKEKEVYANDLSFSVSEVVSSESFALKITTNTPDVNKKNLKLSVLAGGESVIDFEPQVEIGEIFRVYPKQQNGVNFGGNATLVATYDYDNSNQSVKAYCDIMIDVPAESIQIKTNPITTTLNQRILIAGKDQKVSEVFGVNPEHSLMPYVNFGTQKITNIVDKKLYLQLVYKNAEDMVLEKNVAKFLLDNVPQDKEYIEVSYSYRKVDGNATKEIVFDNDIVVETFKQEEVYIKAYLYSTYKDQNNNTVDGLVSLDKNDALKAKLAMTIGDYEITNMTINQEDREVYLNEDTYIYLNNPDVTGNNINLGVQLSTNSGQEANKFYLLNTYIKIDNDSYRLLTNNVGESDTVDGWLSINHEDISRLEKNEWRWKLNVNNFLAYKNNTPLKATIKYEYFDAEKQKTTVFERQFNIIVKINEVESVEVSYPENKTAFDKASGETLNLMSSFTSTPAFDQNSKYGFEMYLSYSENYKNGKTTISTIPTVKNTYKAIFDFVFDGEEGTDYNLSLNAALSNQWCDVNEITYTQVVSTEKTQTYHVNFKNQQGSSDPNNNKFKANKLIHAEVVIVLKAQPTEEDLFVVNVTVGADDHEQIAATDFMVKFYELVDSSNNTYSDFPYLSVDGVKYFVDFDFYKDETTLTKYVKLFDNLTATNSYKVQGIGTIYVTAQLVYKDGDTSYWLDKSATAKVEVYEEIETILAYEYIDGGDGATYDNAFSVSPITENEKDGEGNKVNRYIYITSPELDSLKNYVSSEQVEIIAEQIFNINPVENDRIIAAYTGIKDINKNAITFIGSFVPVVVNDAVVGFKIGYTIGEVYDIEVDESILQGRFVIKISVKVNGEPVYAKFSVQINPNDPNSVTEQEYLNVEITNIVLETAHITYGNDNINYTEGEPFEIYADVDNASGEVKYKYYLNGNTDFVDFNNLKYYFKFNDATKEKTTETLTATFDATVDGTKDLHMTNGGAYFKFEKNSEGFGGLTFKNFPRFANGVDVKMTISSQTMLEFNSFYSYDASAKIFRQTQYDISESFYFKIYGLVINISANDSEIYGGKDEELSLLSSGEDSVFAIEVRSTSSDAKYDNGRSISNYLKILNVSIDNTDLFVKDDKGALEYSDNGLTLKFAKDIIEDENVVVMFYIGDNPSTNSLISINVFDEYLTSYRKQIKSPFEVELVENFEAPSKDNKFVTVLYKTESFDGLDAAALASKRAEAEQNALEKLNVNVEYKNSTLNSSYNITSPVSVSNSLLTFKAVPTANENEPAYTANMLVVLSLIEGGTPREIQKTIKVYSSIVNDDIVVGNYFEDGDDSYYYIDAGVDYLVDKDDTPDINEGIVISGKLKEYFAYVDNISFEFEDVSYEVDDNINVQADVHMRPTRFDVATKNFGVMSDDINYEKVVKIIFLISLSDGGKVILSKNVVVKPNIVMKLAISSFKEGDDINLTTLFLAKKGTSDVFEQVDILNYFDYEDEKAIYNKNSFKFNELAFTDKSGVYYILGVKAGASQLTSEQRTITFNYVVNNYQTYILAFSFEVEISAY